MTRLFRHLVFGLCFLATSFVSAAGQNQPPVLGPIGPQSVDENIPLGFAVSATDAESTPVLTTSTLPGGVVFTDNGDGTGSFAWTPDFTQSGTYFITFFATDDSLAVDLETVEITVVEVGNQLPVLDPIGPHTVTEGVSLNFVITASDGESIPTITSTTLWFGATLIDNADGTADISWTPSFTQSNTYFFTVFATDDSGAVDQETVSITVLEAGNQSPVLAGIGPQVVIEGDVLSVPISSSDAESYPLLTSTTLPPGAVLTDNGEGTGNLDWTPTFFQSGIYSVTFYATDDSLVVDSEVVTITVTDTGNQLPVLAAIGSQSTTEMVPMSVAVSASDGESTPTLTTSTLPPGAVFTDNADGTGSFNWIPNFSQAGGYSITFYATDDSLAIDSEVVAVTVVEAGNQLPTLTPIGPHSATENVQLVFPVSGTDAESIPSLTALPLPAGAILNDNGDGTGSFVWTPSFIQAGVHNIVFLATDDSLASDSELVIITVAEVGNQPPVLAPIGAQSTAENVLLSVAVSGSDPENIPTLTTSTLPAGAAFIDNVDGTGTLFWTPSYTQSGVYPVTFYATDDSSAVDSEQVALTVVDAGNQLPVLAVIGSKNVDENIILAFGVSAGDPESTPTLTTSTLPTGASFVDNADGTGNFSWTPGYIQSGVYSITFYATDDSLAVDSEMVAVTVNQVNLPPVLALIGAQTTPENSLLAFSISASDTDATIPVLTTTALPAGAVFVDNGDGSGSFDWTSSYMQSGIYPVVFYATDDSLAVDSEAVTITVVDAGNQLPVLTTIGPQNTPESNLLSFAVSAGDPESIPALTTSGLPTGANFMDNGDGTGTFWWMPSFLQSGVYLVSFYATDDSLAVDSEGVLITVVDAGNQSPVLSAIGGQSTTEGTTLNIPVSASDAESVPILTTSALPTGAIFTDNGNGTGSFDWSPTFLQSGIYALTFYATDDSLAIDSEMVAVTVVEAGNQSPVLATIGVRSTTENVPLNFSVFATDDESIPALTISPLPTGASFVDNADGTGSFSWTPGYMQSGVYPVMFYATDDSLVADSEAVIITVVDAGNQSPVLASIGAQSGTENANLTFSISATDPESIPTLTTSVLPAGAVFTDNSDGTGSFAWTPSFVQAGVHSVTFIATDDSAAAVFEVVTITIAEVGNQFPVLAPVGPQNTTENVLLTIAVSATDAESIPALTTSALPSGAVFTDNADGTGDLSWTPNFVQSGPYSITFYATDDSSVVDSEMVSVTVTEAGNQMPMLTSIGSQVVDENALLSIGIFASDAESIPQLTTSALPTGAVFSDNADGTASFSWTPGYDQSGVYLITFYATDDSLSIDSEMVSISVNQVNLPPVLALIGAQATTENVSLIFAIAALDTDATIPLLSTSGLPAGVVFIDSGNGNGSFAWTPSFIQSGVYPITFYATDDSLASDSEVVLVTVTEAGNQSPVLSAIGPQSTDESVLLSFGVSSSDPESIPLLTTSSLPTGAIFIDHADGTGSFAWTPGFVQSGSYAITFYATDDSSSVDSETVAIDVVEIGNQQPVLTPIGAQSVSEGSLLSLLMSAGDAESIPALTTSSLPSGALFTDHGNGSATLSWTPTFFQSGIYSITFSATDDSLAVDSEVVTVTVVEAGNQTPILSSIGPQSTTENNALVVAVAATDAESVPALTTSSLPTGASFVDNVDGTGSLSWTPNFLQSGIYPVTFYATDDSLAVDSEVVVVTVTDAGNQAPVLAPIGSQSTDENQLLVFSVSASDAESVPILTTSTLPSGAVFTDNGNGSGDFVWTPDLTQSGLYMISFTATDDSLSTDEEIVQINVQAIICCTGTRGDMNGDGTDLDIVDLTCIVDFLFGSGCSQPCPEEADPNGDGAISDIVDLTFNVDFLFGSAPTLVPCP